MNRVNSNTPLQALDLLNDPIFVESARVFAQNIVRQGGPAFDRQLDWAFGRALDRTPTPEERQILKDLYRKNLARFQASPEYRGATADAWAKPPVPQAERFRK